MFSYGHSKTNIEEANKHLHMLTERVVELETELKEKTEAMEKRERDVQAHVADIMQKSQMEISSLSDKLFKSQQSYRKIESMLEERDEEIRVLREKCHLMDEMVKFKPALAKLTISLEQAESFTNYAIKKHTYGDRMNGDHSSRMNSEMTPNVTERLAKAMLERKGGGEKEFYM